MLDGSSFFHTALVVADLDRSMRDLAGAVGVRWASPMCFETSLWSEEGTTSWTMRVAYSTQGGQLFELIEARRTSGTSTFYDLAAGAQSRLHHVGAWSDAFASDIVALGTSGARLVAASPSADRTAGEVGAPEGIGFYRLGTGLLVEVIDTANRPGFSTWLAGGPPPM